jgi:site-specific DNA-methyltransferase (adenine-specific)
VPIYEIMGAATDVQGTEALKEISPHQFEWWAVDLVNARPARGESARDEPAKDHKKGADTGIDGYIRVETFAKAERKTKTQQAGIF